MRRSVCCDQRTQDGKDICARTDLVAPAAHLSPRFSFVVRRLRARRVARAWNCQNYHNSGCPVLRARCEGRASLASTSFGSNVKKGADLYRRRHPSYKFVPPALAKSAQGRAPTSQSGKEKRLVKGYRGEILLPRVCEPIDAPASQS